MSTRGLTMVHGTVSGRDEMNMLSSQGAVSHEGSNRALEAR